MKKIFQLTTLVAMALVVFSCTKKEVSTEQYDTTAVVLKAYGPQPVVRGGILRFVGSNLDKVVTVTIPGVAPITPEVVTSGAHSEIRITVPKDGPELGYPVLTLADGSTITAKTQLTYSEPIVFESFSPTEVLPGATITIKGDYLNLIHEVILPGDVYIPDDLFVAHDRYTIKVTVPETARTGKIGLGTLDESEVEDDKVLATLNVVESEEDLVVLTAEGALTAKSYKAGDAVTIKGTNLNLTKKVELEGADVTEFAATATTLTFVLPDTATDGEVLMVMASEVAVLAGEITTVVPVVSGVTPAPVKNGAVVTLAGSDLDLVTGLDFPNAAGAEFAFAEGLITATVPEAAQEGDITLHLANGKTVTADLTLVKPTVTGFSANPASAGSDVTIEGTDLDLVASVTFEGAEAVEVKPTATAITVAVPTAAETGVIVLNLINGTSVETIELAVDKPAGAYIAAFPEAMYAPGAVFVVDIENAEHLTGVQIDGADVTYILSGNTLYVSIPDNAKRGSKLTLVSDNGSVTYVMNIDPGDIIETVLWTGSLEIAGWANNEMRDNLIFTTVEMKEGQTIRFYGDFADWWCLQFFDGHWGELTLGFNDEKHHMVSARVVPEAKEQGYFAITLTAEMIEKLQTYTDWGYWGIIQGEGLTLKKITYYEDNSDGTEIWADGPRELTWSDGGRVGLPVEAFKVAKAGQKLRLFYTQKDQVWGQIQVNDGSWSKLDLSGSGLKNEIVPTDLYGWFADGVLDRVTEIILTPELLETIIAKASDFEGTTCGVIIQGQDEIFTKVTIK